MDSNFPCDEVQCRPSMEDCQTHSRCFGTDVVICRRMGLHHPQSCSKNQTSAPSDKAVFQSDPNARPISASAGSTKRACSLDCDGIGSHGPQNWRDSRSAMRSEEHTSELQSP